MVRVLVCGGRDFGVEDNDERDFVINMLEKFAEENSQFYNPTDNWLPNDIHIISGLAKGPDTIAVDWAVTNWTSWIGFPADWDTHGRKAGAIRNHQMLVEGKPDIVLAFPGGRGTEHMKKIAKRAGIPVVEYDYVQDNS